MIAVGSRVADEPKMVLQPSTSALHAPWTMHFKVVQDVAYGRKFLSLIREKIVG